MLEYSLVLATALVCVDDARAGKAPNRRATLILLWRVQALPCPTLRVSEQLERRLCCQLRACCGADGCVPVFMLRAAIAKNSGKGCGQLRNNKLTQAQAYSDLLK